MKNIYLLVLFLLLTFNLSANWETCEKFDCLAISDTTIKQIEFTEDERYVYVLDYNYNFFKVDLSSGEILTKMNLAKTFTSESEKVLNVKIGFKAKNIGILFLNKNSFSFDNQLETDTLKLKVFDIDSLILRGTIEMCPYNLLPSSANLFVNSFLADFYLFDQKIVFYANWSYRIYGGKNERSVSNGRFYIGELVDNQKFEIKKIFDFSTKFLTFVPPNNLIILGNWFEMYSWWWAGKTGTEYKSESYAYLLNTYDFSTENIKPKIYNLTKNSFELADRILPSKETDTIYFVVLSDTVFIVEPLSFNLKKSFRTPGIPNAIETFLEHNLLFISFSKKILVYNFLLLKSNDTIEIENSNIENIFYSVAWKKFYFTTRGKFFRIDLENLPFFVKAYFETDLNNYFVNTPIQFYNKSTGKPTFWLWDFGDGEYSTEYNPIHSYKDTGVFNVKLIVGRGGINDTSSAIIEILPNLEAKFNYSVLEYDCSFSVKFINESSGKVDSVFWDFGDGVTSKEYNPYHNFLRNGIFNVSLKAFSGNYTSTYEIPVNVISNKFVKEANFIPIDSFSLVGEFPNYLKITSNVVNADNYYPEQLFRVKRDKNYFKAILLSDNSLIFHNGKALLKLLNNNLVWKVDKNFGSIIKVPKVDLILFYPEDDSLIYILNTDGKVVTYTRLYEGNNIPLRTNVEFFDYSGDEVLVLFPKTTRKFPYGWPSYYSLEVYSALFNVKSFKFSPSQLLKSFEYYSYYFPTFYKGKVNFAGIKLWRIYLICEKRSGATTYDIQFKCYFFVDSINYCVMLQPNPFYGDCDRDPTSLTRWRKQPLCLDIRGAEALNDSMIIVIDNTNLLFANMNEQTGMWKKIVTDFDNLVKLARVNDTLFIAIGSKARNPYYAIYNLKGEMLESASLSCYQGEFKDVTISENGTVLLTAQIFREMDTNSWEFFFVKLNSPVVNEVLAKTTRVLDENTNFDIQINPNIVTNLINLPDWLNLEKVRIKIFDVLGGEVLVFDVLRDHKIDVSNLINGIYFLEIDSRGKKYRTKFIKI